MTPPRFPTLRQEGPRFQISNLEERTYLFGIDADVRGCSTVEVIAILHADGPQELDDSILGEAPGRALPLSEFIVVADDPAQDYNVYISTSDCWKR